MSEAPPTEALPKLSERIREEPDDRDDMRLLVRLKAGDSAAFEAIYERYSDRIRAYLRTVLGSAEDAEDGAQEVFAKLLEALPRFEVRDVPPRIWLYRTAHNYARDYRDKHHRVTAESPEQIDQRLEAAAGASAEEEARVLFADREFLRVLARLPQRQAQVLYMRFAMSLEVKEIAERLGLNQNAVRNLQHRAFKTLRPRYEALAAGAGVV